MTTPQLFKNKFFLSSNKLFRLTRLSKKLKAPISFNKFSKLKLSSVFDSFEYTWNSNPALIQSNTKLNLPETRFFALEILKNSIQLYKILKLISIVIGKKKKILFLSTQEKYKYLVNRAASNSNELAYTSKWIGGYLTNFEQIQTSSLLKNKKRLKKNQQPSLIISVDCKKSEMAAHEAFLLNIPVISFSDIYSKDLITNSSIPGDANYLPFVYHVLNWIVKVINKKKGIKLSNY